MSSYSKSPRMQRNRDIIACGGDEYCCIWPPNVMVKANPQPTKTMKKRIRKQSTSKYACCRVRDSIPM